MPDFCLAWPDEVKALSRAHYRAVCRMKNLEAYIERVSPYEFDAVMDVLEQAHEQVQALAIQFEKARWAWEWRDYPKARNRETAEKK